MSVTSQQEPPGPARRQGPRASQPSRRQHGPRQEQVMVVTLPGTAGKDGQANDWLVLGGDIDQDTYPDLIEALKRLPPTTPAFMSICLP